MNIVEKTNVSDAEFLFESTIKSSHNQEFLLLEQEQGNNWMYFIYQCFQIILTYIMLRLLWGEETFEEIVWPLSSPRLLKDARTKTRSPVTTKKKGHLIAKSIAYFTASILLYKIIPNYERIFQWMDLDDDGSSEMY